MDLIDDWWDAHRPPPDIDIVIGEWEGLRMKLGFEIPPSFTSPERRCVLEGLISTLDASMHGTKMFISKIRASQARAYALLDRFNRWAHRTGVDTGEHGILKHS